MDSVASSSSSSSFNAQRTQADYSINRDFNQSTPSSVDDPVLLTSLSSLGTFLVSFPALREWARLFIIGGLLEAGRRLLYMLWTHLVNSLFVTAEFEDRDDTFKWLMFWLSKQPSWNQSHNVRVSTSRFGHSGVADQLPGEDEGKEVNPLRRLAYAPTHNTTQHMWYNGTWMHVTRHRTPGDMWNRNGDERLTITLFTRSLSKLDRLLLEAKRAYKKESEGRINIYVSDNYNEWTLAGSRPRRPLSSVVLEKGIKESLLADAKDFMANERWYAERGIPWRRGYLLHGTPGSGKTSLIHSLAGELELDIYVISLSKKGLDDSSLNELVSKMPSRSLALMEEIDAAFFRGVSREGPVAQSEKPMPGQPPGSEDKTPQDVASSAQGNAGGGGGSVTLSGLLGAIDGVTAQEGRLLFATTNRYSALDSALVRPGRLDVHVRFENAGRAQVEELFRCFFLPSTMPSAHDDKMDRYESELTDEGYASGSDISVQDIEDVEEETNSAIHRVDSCTTSTILKITKRQVCRLAKNFARRVPDKEFSMAAIQGLLMQYKTRPRAAIKDLDAWIESERQKKAEREGKPAKAFPMKESGAEGAAEGNQQSPEVLDNVSNKTVTSDSLPCIWWPLGML